MRTLLLLIGLTQIFLGWSQAKTVTASGGTPGAVQSAIDSAADGDTVMIPAGKFTWSSGINIKKPVKVFGFGPTTEIQNTGDATLVTMIPSPKGNAEFGKVKFTRTGTSTGMYVFGAEAPGGKPMLVHDLECLTAKFGNRSIDWAPNGGVIYKCTFVSTDKGDNSGVAFKNPSSDSAWHEPDFMGMKDANGDRNTYLEDCTFKDIFLQAMDFDDNSRVVIRHCVFDNSAVASHGQETSAIGARAWEVYDNEFIFTKGTNNNPGPQDYPLNMNHFLFIRGGGPGVVFRNKIPDISSSAWGNKSEVKFCLYNIRRRGQVPCQQLPPPAAHQIGWGINEAGQFVQDPVYIWENTGGGNYSNPSIEDYNPDECGNNLHTSQFVRKNQEYFLDTAKPDYTPYTYPHPLRSGDVGPQPTPEPTATPIPTPTATPMPSPTATPEPPRPTPTPVKTFEKWLEEQNDWVRSHPPYPDQP